MSQNPADGSSFSHQPEGNVSKGLTFNLSDFLSQQNKVEFTSSPQETTFESDSSVEGETNTPVIHLFKNTLFSVPKLEESAQEFQFSVVPNQIQIPQVVIPSYQTTTLTIHPSIVHQKAMAQPALIRMQ